MIPSHCQAWHSGLALIALLVPCEVLRAQQTNQELLRELVATHTATVESLRTFSCKIAVDDGPSHPEATVTGEYFRCQDDIRVREFYPDGRTEDRLVKDSRILSIGNDPRVGKGRERVAAAISSADEPFCECDVWKLMLLNFPGHKAARVSLKELVHLPHRRCDVERIETAGKKFIRLVFAYDDPDSGLITLRVWFDVALNALVAKMDTLRVVAGQENRVEAEIVRFVEAAPTLFVPTESRIRAIYGGKEFSLVVTRLSEVKVNQPLPNGIFELQIPSGVPVADRIRAKIYRAGPDGQPSGPERPLFVKVPPPLTSLPAQAVGSQTLREQNVGRSWVTIGAISLVLALGCFWYLWSRRSSRPIPSLRK